MTQRTLAGILAVPLLIGLWVTAALVPLPYVTYEPGLTVNVLGDNDDGKPIIAVTGAKSYADDGQLRMTTVYVSQPRPEGKNNLFELMRDWASDEDAVYPYDAVYRQDETVAQNKQEGAAQMTSSQDAATAVALEELGYDVTEPVVADVTAGAPAEGRLRAGDVVLSVDGAATATTQDVVDAVTSASAGEPVTFVVRRDGQRRTVQVTPRTVDGKPQVGISVGAQVKKDLPVDVAINLSDGIGGPSAGLMFSLGIYDTLTPGSLTGGKTVAGTGTMDATGAVGPIGGIQQKIVGARDAGAQLFLVPPDNCQDALGAPNGDMRLVRADTMHDARVAIQAWVKDPDATLPSCEGVAS
ncbi:PDZ domain-containing protein [Nocardioides sp.]|uniref:PDZ domain-containing protein n=1 Tax=Nocardioides sp. TaxID=35761 RepID=UPI003783A84C